MAFSKISMKLFAYLILTNLLFINVFAITPCQVKTLPTKLQTRDALFVNKSAQGQKLLQERVATTVNLSLSINNLNILDIKNMEMEIDLGMTQKWYDHRLSPDYETQKLAVLGAIWQPKITFVVGSRCATDILKTNGVYNHDETQFWRGAPNGSVIYSERLSVKPECSKDLTRYPFDTQTCYLKIGSYRFTAEEVSLNWSSIMPIELRVKKELGEFFLDKYKTYEEIDQRSSGNFSILVFEIYLSRHTRREIIQSFLPSIVLVKIAYGMLWTKLSDADIRTRIFGCQFSLLGILSLFSFSNYGVSNFTYVKALDIWFLMCLVFVLLPLAESILINYSRKLEENFGNEGNEVETGSAENKERALRIDKILRIIHPIGLLSSSVLFFTVFKNVD